MSLSKSSLETLLDLVEIKLSCMDVWDRDDERELKALELARRELNALASGATVQGIPSGRRRGRPPLRRLEVTTAASC